MSHQRITSRLNLALGLFVALPAASVAPAATAGQRTLSRVGARVTLQVPARPVPLRIPARTTGLRTSRMVGLRK